MEPLAAGAGPQPVEVAFAGPEAQRRLTVAFRIFLLIPHAIVLFFLAIAVYVVAVAAWFAALALGRVPEGLANFISGVVRYTTRVYAYGYLLTDRYPPFSLDAVEYPVQVSTFPGRLNRLAVLFRIILMIPAYIVTTVVIGGVGVVMFFAWLIVLVAGRMPVSLHQAIAAVLRYEVRYYSYVALVSAAYPDRLFGDDRAPTPPAEDSAATPAPLLPPPAAPAPLASRLVLTAAAKRIIVLFLVLGALPYAGSIAVSAATGGSVNRVETLNQLNGDYSQLSRAVAQFQTTSRDCSGTAGISCAQGAARDLGRAFSTFAQQVQSLDVPALDQPDANRLVNDSNQLAGVLEHMGSAASEVEYLALARQFQTTASSFDSDYQTLGQDLLTG
ncbi:MAG TPA: DUF4389 domain-containing protein [Acidimicrobiales bacterium]|nr:DUF4389 domain-containing protein [Acidimicrobiales bacterium]